MADISPSTQATFTRRLPLLIIVAAALFGAVFLRDAVSFEMLRDNRDALFAFRDENYAATVALFLLIYVVIVALSLPGATIATLTGGFLFATFPGVLFNVTAATLGAIVIFTAARAGLGDRLSARLDASEGAARRIKDGIDENQWSMLFVMRLVPIVPFFVANLIPALVGVSLLRFAVSTFFGIMPGTLVFTSVGAGMGEVIALGETPDLGIIFTPPILFPMLGLAALAMLPVAVKALRARGRVA